MGKLKPKVKATTKKQVPLVKAPERPSTKTATPQPVALTMTRINEGGGVQTMIDFAILTDDSDRVIGQLNGGLSPRYVIKRA